MDTQVYDRFWNSTSSNWSVHNNQWYVARNVNLRCGLSGTYFFVEEEQGVKEKLQTWYTGHWRYFATSQKHEALQGEKNTIFYAFSEQTLGVLSQRCAMTLISLYFPMSTLSQSSATVISVLQSSSSNSSARISWPSSLSLSTMSIRKSWFELISWRHFFWRIHLRIWWGKGRYLHTVKC